MWARTFFTLAILGAIVLASLAVRSLFLCVKSPGDVFVGIFLAVFASVCLASLPILFFQTVREAAMGAVQSTVQSTKNAVVRNVRQGSQEVSKEIEGAAKKTLKEVSDTATTTANKTLQGLTTAAAEYA